MTNTLARRELLRGGVALAGLAVLGVPRWAAPALAQGEEVVPFADVPESFSPGITPRGTYISDTREIRSFLTPNSEFFVVQHYGQPEPVEPTAYRLRISGLVESPMEFTLDDLKALERVELVTGFECSGNSKRMLHGLVGNARWGGVKLADVLRAAGVRPDGREVVFFGRDSGTETIRRTEVEQRFARSLSLDDALNLNVMLAFEMNGEPLPYAHGAPVRLIVPGWYGVAQVKWLEEIRLQDTRFMGRFMARDYVTLRGYEDGDTTRWLETSVGPQRLKSVIVRVTRTGDRYKILGFALCDGTALESIEVRIDGGAWHRAEIDPESSKYSWTLFTYDWPGASPGEHTLVSRVTDVDGRVQPLEEDLEPKPTYWENNGLHPRKVLVS